jgi:hypothetical protein
MIQSDENSAFPIITAAAAAASQREEKPCTCEACRDKRYVCSDHLLNRNYSIGNMQRYQSD